MPHKGCDPSARKDFGPIKEAGPLSPSFGWLVGWDASVEQKHQNASKASSAMRSAYRRSEIPSLALPCRPVLHVNPVRSTTLRRSSLKATIYLISAWLQEQDEHFGETDSELDLERPADERHRRQVPAIQLPFEGPHVSGAARNLGAQDCWGHGPERHVVSHVVSRTDQKCIAQV